MRYGIGLDIGIASVGFATVELDEDDKPIRIIKLGSRIFDKAEQPKTGASLAMPRREARGMRRRLRRKAHRKERIRKLIITQGLLTKDELDKLYLGLVTDIYKLRVNALDRLLNNEELARILIHLAQRRGFKSNRKADKGGDEGKLKKATSENKKTMEKEGFRTVAELLHNKEVKRNKEDDYTNTVLREMVLYEAAKIFESQRNLGNVFCTKKFEEKYIEILSSQRPFDEGPGNQSDGTPSPYKVDFENLVGYCTLEKGEKRAPKASYAFERFNLLQKINREWTEDENGTRRHLNKEERIAQIAEEYKNKNSKLLKGYHKMNKALKGVLAPDDISEEMRNKIARIFSLYKNDARIQKELEAAGFEQSVITTLVNKLDTFSKFGNLSVKAMNKIIPLLEEGMTYDKACKSAGYDFKGQNDGAKSNTLSLKDLAQKTENEITSPVAKRALSQCAKVVNAIIREHGTSPVYINIELAREMAKDFENRTKAEKAMKSNRDNNEKAMNQLKEYDVQNPTGHDLVKFKLWTQQNEICMYSGEVIPRKNLFEPGYEIDHIIPYSVSYDDSYNNKVLVLSRENQQKANRLPLEYLIGQARDNFIVRVKNSNLHWRKKNSLLKESITDEDTERFIQRNLTDTQTITTFMYNYLVNNLEFSPFNINHTNHVTPVNGAITSHIRKRLGINKIRDDGDKHHAIDALVVACTTQGMIKQITNLSKYKEKQYLDDGDIDKINWFKKGKKFPRPWEYFLEELQARLSHNPLDSIKSLPLLTYPAEELDPDNKKVIKEVFVSRMVSRKITGAAHEATITGIAEDDNQIKRVPLSKLKLDKNGEIANYYRPEADLLLYNALKQELIIKGKDAFKEDFRRPTDERLVKKVKILEVSSNNVKVHKSADGTYKGSANNDSMIRIDVFNIPDGKDKGYYFVPIYIADSLKDTLPNMAYPSKKEMVNENFIFSLYANDLIYIKHKTLLSFKLAHKNSSLNEKYEIQDEYVYYKKADISTGAIKVITHDNSYKIKSLGIKTLLEFKKCQIDVLGNISKVTNEKRKGFSQGKDDINGMA